MPIDLNGYWKMISNDNFEEYLKALGELNDMNTPQELNVTYLLI